MARFAAVLLISIVGTSATAQEPTGSASGLETLFSPGPIFQDRNGDGVIDFVDAAIVVGESPTISDIAAAADIAARLGYETMAMDISLGSLEESSGPRDPCGFSGPHASRGCGHGGRPRGACERRGHHQAPHRPWT